MLFHKPINFSESIRSVKDGKKDVLHSLGYRKVYKAQCFALRWLLKFIFQTFPRVQESGFISKTTRKCFEFFSLHV